MTDRQAGDHGRPAVFLDRDGTLIEDIGYLREVAEIQLFPWTVNAVRRLNDAGLPVVVVTNQSGVARGIVSESRLGELHQHISEALEANGARIDAYYYCPHHPEGTIERYAMRCDCRKPGRGMIDQAARSLQFDPARSFVVGDKWLDIGLARTIGARGILVRTGYGAGEEARPQRDLAPDIIVDTLQDAVDWILSDLHS